MKDRLAEQRFQCRAVYDVYGIANQLSDVELQSRVLKYPHFVGRVQVHQDIDVTIRAGFTAGNG